MPGGEWTPRGGGGTPAPGQQQCQRLPHLPGDSSHLRGEGCGWHRRGWGDKGQGFCREARGVQRARGDTATVRRVVGTSRQKRGAREKGKEQLCPRAPCGAGTGMRGQRDSPLALQGQGRVNPLPKEGARLGHQRLRALEAAGAMPEGSPGLLLPAGRGAAVPQPLRRTCGTDMHCSRWQGQAGPSALPRCAGSHSRITPCWVPWRCPLLLP